jgi:hypothetical protein
MDFQQTGLPDSKLFHDAFRAGWPRYLDRFEGDAEKASAQYLRGPAAMARLICEHGGDCRHVAAAACLAGPAVFSAHPADWLNSKLVEFSRDVTGMDTTSTRDFCGMIPRQSGDARLFFQASAILLMEQLADPVTGPRYSAIDAQKTYVEALEIYSAARGAQDTYKLDTRFEIAAMKVTTVLESRPHIWTQCRKPAVQATLSVGLPL